MDFKKVLEEIKDHGLTDKDIGEIVGTSQSVIHRIRVGKHKSTTFERGTKIIKLLEFLNQQKKDIKQWQEDSQ